MQPRLPEPRCRAMDFLRLGLVPALLFATMAAAAAKPPALPQSAPPPEPRPAPAEPKPLADPRSVSVAADRMPAGEVACRKRLAALGVRFEDRAAEHDAAVGCSLPYPLAVETLGAAVELAPAALMNCRMAEAAARFVKDVAAPAAEAGLGSPLKSIAQASAYVCRPRHNGQKMSEHAFGNALDIAGFTLRDGTVVEVGPSPPHRQAGFLDTVREKACGPFKTVLGPGSDADHATHLHLDLEPRRNGGTFCQ